jgi:hypothetical protein
VYTDTTPCIVPGPHTADVGLIAVTTAASTSQLVLWDGVTTPWITDFGGNIAEHGRYREIPPDGSLRLLDHAHSDAAVVEWMAITIAVSDD